VTEHWSIFAPLYFQGRRPMTRKEFSAKFLNVREARNDIYHHKSLARMNNVVFSAEELLDRIGCSLSFSYEKITGAAVSPPNFRIAKTQQYNLF
jgi:hypothetical protein